MFLPLRPSKAIASSASPPWPVVPAAAPPDSRPRDDGVFDSLGPSADQDVGIDRRRTARTGGNGHGDGGDHEEHRSRWPFVAAIGTGALYFGAALTFLGGQLLEHYEFVVEGGFTLTSGVFWSGFYGLTGLHGFHVLVGVVFARALRGQYDAERDTSVATASLYWYFVDAVWLFLVAVLYVGATV